MKGLGQCLAPVGRRPLLTDAQSPGEGTGSWVEPSAATSFSRESALVKSERGIGSSVIFKLDSWASWHPLEIEMEEERTVNRGVPLPQSLASTKEA